MTKTLTVTFGTTVLGTTYYGAVANSSMLSFVLDTQHRATLIRATLALIICLYCIAGPLRTRISRFLILAIGAGLMYLGFGGLLTPHIADRYNYYILPVDIFFAIEGGIISALLGLQLSLHQPPKRFSLRPTTINLGVRKSSTFYGNPS